MSTLAKLINPAQKDVPFVRAFWLAILFMFLSLFWGWFLVGGWACWMFMLYDTRKDGKE